MENRKLKVVLASQSPRRKELLAKAGFDFEIVTSDVEENTLETAPDKIVMELSRIKAEDVLNKVKTDGEKLIVIGADTVVSKNGQIMGKPKTKEEAFEMIDSIQGDIHQVFTGVTIYFYDGENINKKSFAEKTDVVVFPMKKEEIEAYIATGDSMDKAGAYGIQGAFGVFVEKINGDYNNVVGLPVARLYHELQEYIG